MFGWHFGVFVCLEDEIVGLLLSVSRIIAYVNS